ncbi:MAG TPA: hypothetical protein VF623_09525 [Segetibacter sp.]|jgi:hypothetical protein
MAVVTAEGTNYAMKVHDPAKFAAYAALHLNTDAKFKAFEDGYKSDVVGYTLGRDKITAYELALAALLENSGITLLKGNSDFSGYSVVTKSSGNHMTSHIDIHNCNN